MGQENNNLQLRLEALKNDSTAKKIDLTILDEYEHQYRKLYPKYENFRPKKLESFQPKFERPRSEKDTFTLDIRKEYFGPNDRGFLCLEQYDSANNLLRKVSISQPGDELIRITEKIDEIFNYCEYYYPNGTMRGKEIVSFLRFSIGMLYVFDENGVLIRKEDTDDGYTFTYEDVLLFCKEKGMSIENISGINKLVDAVENIKIWSVSHRMGDVIFTYQLDAADGRIIRTFERSAIRH